MKKYKLEVTLKEDGKLHFASENDGFNSFEVLAFLVWKSDDIKNQMCGSVKPDVVERKVIQD